MFARPGSRITSDVLRGYTQGILPAAIEIPANESRMLINLPIPVGNVTPSSNGRSTLMRMSSSNSVYVASLAMFAPTNPAGVEQYPTLQRVGKYFKYQRFSGAKRFSTNSERRKSGAKNLRPRGGSS